MVTAVCSTLKRKPTNKRHNDEVSIVVQIVWVGRGLGVMRGRGWCYDGWERIGQVGRKQSLYFAKISFRLNFLRSHNLRALSLRCL